MKHERAISHVRTYSDRILAFHHHCHAHLCFTRPVSLPFFLLVRLLIYLLFCLQTQQEVDVLRVCQHKVRQRSLPMKIVDAEYQFDMHKLTLFFEAERYVEGRIPGKQALSMGMLKSGVGTPLPACLRCRGLSRCFATKAALRNPQFTRASEPAP